MAMEFNTIGVKIGWATESTIGSRPTSGYTNIPDIKEIPAIELTPSNLDVTNLVDKNRRYIPGVQDAGNDIALTANLTASMKTAWESLISAANTGWASGFATWFQVSFPNFDSFYFAGLPSDIGMNQMGVDAVAEATLHIIPNKIGGWAS